MTTRCMCTLCGKIPEGTTVNTRESYSIRITRPYVEIMDWIAGIGSLSNIVVCYEHEADEEVSRTHCHILVYGDNMEKDTMKKRFIKLYGKPEKTDWYFKTTYDKGGVKTPVDLHLITYMSKGKLDAKYIHRIEPIRVLEYKQQWVTPGPKLVVEGSKFVVKDGDKEPKLTKWEMLERMQGDYTPEMTTKEVIEIIRKVLKKNHQVIGMYKIMDYYDSIMLYSNKETMTNMIETAIARRLR